jgi:translocation protein SEC62
MHMMQRKIKLGRGSRGGRTNQLSQSGHFSLSLSFTQLLPTCAFPFLLLLILQYYPISRMAAPGQPSPQQMAAMQQQFAAEAAKRGMTPQEFAAKQREQLTADATKLGLTTEQYVTQLRMRAMQAHQQQQQQAQAEAEGKAAPEGQQQQQAQSPAPQQHQHQTTQQVPVNPNNPPDPKAIAVANWLRSQNLKPRTCIMDGQRKDMFKGKPMTTL